MYISIYNKILNRGINENSIFKFLKDNSISEEDFYNMIEYLKKENLLSDFLENYSYKVVNMFINGNYKNIYEFYKQTSITKSDFSFSISLVKKYNNELYSKYLEKQDEIEKEKTIKIKRTIKKISNKIKSNNITKLEFLILVPFKESKNYKNTLLTFIKDNMPSEEDTFITYLDNNRDLSFKRFIPLSINKIINNKNISHNNIEVSDIDKKAIYEYMVEENYPLYEQVFFEAKNEYYKEEFNREKYKKLVLTKKSVNKISKE